MIKALALGFAMAMRVLFCTVRRCAIVTVAGTNPYDTPGSDRFLYSVWHDSMVIPTFGGRHRCSTALTSHHADGSFVAETLRWQHISAVRGSTNRISTGGLRDLLAKTQTRHLVITPDGPRGPNRRMSAGIIYLASRTGRAIVPTAYACSRCWRIKGSWSDLIIPKPFARVVLMAGTPIHIQPGLKRMQIQRELAKVQNSMDQLNAAAIAALDTG